MKDDAEAISAVEKVLKEPVAAEFSDQAWRIRTNLIVTSTIALVMSLANLRIQPDSSFLGLKFSGLSDDLIAVILAAIIVYLLFHFLWVAWDGLLEWRLRVTGTRTLYQTGAFYGPDHVDYPVDPRQSTLHNWWAMQHGTIGELGQVAEDLRQKCRAWEAELQKLKDANPDSPAMQNLHNATHLLAATQEQASRVAQMVQHNTEKLSGPRIPTSLARFDRWYQLFLRSQNLRWLVVEFAAPVAFAGYTLFVVVT